MTTSDEDQQQAPPDERSTSGRDKRTESTPTDSGHSTADDQAGRNREDESPS